MFHFFPGSKHVTDLKVLHKASFSFNHLSPSLLLTLLCKQQAVDTKVLWVTCLKCHTFAPTVDIMETSGYRCIDLSLRTRFECVRRRNPPCHGDGTACTRGLFNCLISPRKGGDNSGVYHYEHMSGLPRAAGGAAPGPQWRPTGGRWHQFTCHLCLSGLSLHACGHA